MKTQTLLMIVVGLVVALYLFSGYTKDGSNPSQHEIQTLQNVKDEDGKLVETPILETEGIPYPQISRGFKKLGKTPLPQPLNTLQQLLPSGKDVLPMFRTTEASMTKDRMYLPDYYRKDTMPMNDIGSEEMRPFVRDDEQPDTSWTDTDVSEHPKFYKTDIQNDKLTDIGSFFDKNNQYNDTTSSNTPALPSDTCYLDKQGGVFCLDNTRLQIVPPKLITDPQSCYALNPKGMYNDYKSIPDDPSRVMNGGSFYADVQGSRPLGENETPSDALQEVFGSCKV